MNSAPLRVVAGITLAVVVGAGIYLSGKLVRDSRARVAELRDGDGELADALDRESQRTELADEAEFSDAVRGDALDLSVTGFDYEAFRGPYRYATEIREAVILGAGQSWSSPHLRVSAAHEKVTYQQHGAIVAARHAIAYVENISAVPIGYFLRVRSHDRGHCEVRGARMHNAMALMPKERAEIVVCAGGGKIRLEQLFVLEVPELGAYYLSQVPASAVAHDDVTAGSHRPLKRVGMCTGLDDKGLSTLIKEGETRWVDVMDFYARHNCTRHQFFVGYRYSPDGPARLPAVAPG